MQNILYVYRSGFVNRFYAPNLLLIYYLLIINLYYLSVSYFGIKVFNHLPASIKKTFHDINQFRFVLKSFLIINSFYSEEYFCLEFQ